MILSSLRIQKNQICAGIEKILIFVLSATGIVVIKLGKHLFDTL